MTDVIRVKPDIIREPHRGIYYYAESHLNHIKYRGHVYDIRIWRRTKKEAVGVASTYRYSGHIAIVKKIEFRKGGMFRKDKGARVIHRYAVYTRVGRIE
jgi:hypothetical protein